MNNNNYRETLAEEAARRFQEDYTDGRNRCQRCHRPLNDPMADYGWRCQQILGLNRPNPLMEHFFSNPLGFTNKDTKKPIDKQEQNVYNWDGKTYISEKPTPKRELTQIGNFDLRYLSPLLTPGKLHNKMISDSANYLTDNYQRKVNATQLPQPLGKDKNDEFIYEQDDPRNYLPSIKEIATIAQDIYGADMDNDMRNPKEIILNKNWSLYNILKGRQGMKMGIYIKAGDDVLNPSEYVIVFKGSSGFFEKPEDWMNNLEQAVSSKSADMWDAINCAKGFSEYAGGTKITFVGHSKGGAEAAAAAVATNRDAILFNPANANLKAYGLDGSSYTGNMVQYVVENEILYRTGIGPVSPARIPTIRTAFIKQQIHKPIALDEAIDNHQMTAVIKGLK